MGIVKRRQRTSPFKVGDYIQEVRVSEGERPVRWKVTQVDMELFEIRMVRVGIDGFHTGNMSFSIANLYYEIARGARGFVKQETNIRRDDE